MATVIVTVGLAFIGYLVTYLNGLRLAQRQARLTRVNQQLSDFYGRLFALMEANSRTYDTFSRKYARADGRDPFHHDIPPQSRNSRSGAPGPPPFSSPTSKPCATWW